MADIEYSLPVKVETVAEARTPFCHMCFHPDLLKHLPKADPQKQRPIIPSWVGKSGPNAPKAAKPKAPPKGPKVYTVDDLDID